MYNKKILGYSLIQGVTLLEILLVLAILTVLVSIMIFALRPDDQLTDAYRTEREGKSKSIDKALENYSAQNHGKYPFDKDSLVAGTEYFICKYGATCTGDFIDLDTLVDEGYLTEIPVDPNNDTETDSGYVITKDELNNLEIMALADVPPALPTPTPIECPTGYILIPGNSLYSTSDFCVMKYEAKCANTADPTVGLTVPTNFGAAGYNNSATNCNTTNSKQVVSVASGYPITSIVQNDGTANDAESYCINLGEGYHLITNNEWMTIARNIEQIGGNWTSGIVGTNLLYRGHTINPQSALEASSDDNQGYAGIEAPVNPELKRIHTLSNGEVIWDLSGNVLEWTNDLITEQDQPDVVGQTGYAWREFTSITSYGTLSYDLLRPSNIAWDSTYGVGRINHTSNSSSLQVRVLQRGGYWGDVASGGIYSMYLLTAPTTMGSAVGFRCAVNLVP